MGELVDFDGLLGVCVESPVEDSPSSSPPEIPKSAAAASGTAVRITTVPSNHIKAAVALSGVVGRAEDRHSAANRANIVNPTKSLALSRHDPEQGSLPPSEEGGSAGISLEFPSCVVGSVETSSLSIQYRSSGVEFSIDISNDSWLLSII